MYHPVTSWLLNNLLAHIRGPTSFESLWIIDGVLEKTFMAAAIKAGLVMDNQSTVKTMDEVLHV